MDAKSRKRGVVASRVKLHAAMLNAGIKTQTALADKMADLEGLESPPRDTVNRAFRQESVSPASVARIASALNVEAYTLYLSTKEQLEQIEANNLVLSSSRDRFGLRSGDSESDRVQPKPSQETGSLTEFLNGILKTKYSMFLLMALVLVWIGKTYLSSYSEASTDEPIELKQSTAGGGAAKIAINQKLLLEDITVSIPESASIIIFSKDPAVDKLSQLLNQKLQGNYSVTIGERELVSKHSMATDIAEQFQSDAVLTIRYELHGRYAILQAFLFYQNHDRLFWTASLTRTELSYQTLDIAERAYTAFSRLLGKQHQPELLAGNLTELAPHQNYVQARKLLDGHNSELNVKKAQAILLSTVAQYPNFTNVRAALCEVYLRESWREHEKNNLEYAERECNAGYLLNQNNYYLNAMRGYLYRRSGKVEQAIHLFENALQKSPNNVDSISGIAMAYRDAVRQQLARFPQAERKMMTYAKKATELEPNFWLHHNNLGVLSYTAGKTELIALSFEKSALLNPNELAFANVATINLCQGNLKKAIGFYQDSIRQGPNSYIGYETIGTAYIFSKQFDKAVENKEKALSLMSDEEFGGLYQMWGDLGDAYRLSNKPASAFEAYKKGLTIIHREELRGNFTKADKAFKAYYTLQLTELAKNNFQESGFSFDYQQLDKLMTAEMEASAKAKLAFAFYLLGDVKQARIAMKQATDVCIVYHQHPDWMKFEGVEVQRAEELGASR